MEKRTWKVANSEIEFGARTLVMGILNITPDSFSDRGKYASLDAGLARATEIFAEGADILDVGGESTRPGAQPVTEKEELARVIPIVEAVTAQRRAMNNSSQQLISVDTTKAEVARQALQAGASIINDVSGLRFAPAIADCVAQYGAGVIFMHSLGDFATLHTSAPVDDILRNVKQDWRRAIAEAEARGVKANQIALDVGFGFGKTFAQNLELLQRFDELVNEFNEFPLLVGTSRKRFIERLLGGDVPPCERLHGTMATVAAAVIRGASIVRVHDVKAAVETVKVIDAVKTVKGMSSE